MGDGSKNFWKDRLYNKNVRKRFLYIYVPIALALFLILNVAGFLSVNSDRRLLDATQSFKENVPVVYSDKYNISFWGLEELHPFDTKKYMRIHDALKAQHPAAVEKFITAYKPSAELIQLAHGADYFASLRSSWVLARITELGFLRFFPDRLARNLILEPMLYHMGGSLLAGLAAIEHGWAINLGGGFHHASYDDGGGFCALADIGLTVKYLRREKKITKAMIIDLDAHQGNGHARDFIDDKDVYIVDFYNADVYPRDEDAKRGIDLGFEMRAFSGDKIFFDALEKALPEAFKAFDPDIVIYIAGTDGLEGDPLGAMSISEDGIIKRDEMVFRAARDRNKPIVMLLGGGYQKSNARVIARSILNLRQKFGLF
ncbi:MAG: histone deacetylase [Alphaproteobacteria bacterium]